MATHLSTVAVASGSALSCPAGSNRYGLLFVMFEATAAGRTITSVLWGTEELLSAQVSLVDSNSGNPSEYVAAFPVTEAIIAAQSGQNVAVTGSATINATRIVGCFLQDAPGFSVSAFGSNTGTVQSLSASVSVPTGGFLMAGVCGNSPTSIADFVWTNATERADAASSTVLRYGVATDATSGSRTVTADWSAGASNQQSALLVVALTPAAAASNPSLLTLGVG